jgi:hypothetical protein
VTQGPRGPDDHWDHVLVRAPFLPGWRPDPTDADAPAQTSGHAHGLWVAALAAAACLGWVPFIWRALSPDEGGFLVLAAQWSPGSSLYGDYWVDRPPVLIGLFAVADWFGGADALRVMGVVAVVTTVVLAGAIGRLVAPTFGATALLPAATAAVFVATPLLGGSVVNGELLGVPLVLAGIAAAVASLTATRRRSALAWAVVAGASGVTAFMVKQSILDVFVFVLAVVVSQRRPGMVRLVAGAAGGAVVMTALVLWGAHARGTGAADLWDAVVVFRGQASSVIAESATARTAQRLGGVVLAVLGSGAAFVAGTLIWIARRRPEDPLDDREVRIDLRWPARVLLGWEIVVVFLGGSYWLHYLMGLVPGLVLLAAAAAQRRPRVRAVAAAYGFAAASTLVAIGWVIVNPIARPEAGAIAYLEDHVHPGDTGVVAFGAANIMEAAGLESPYPYLWSLPVRVRDPELHLLADVLAGPEPPTWLIVSGSSLGSWGVVGMAAEEYVDVRYDLATDTGRFAIYHRKDAP